LALQAEVELPSDAGFPAADSVRAFAQRNGAVQAVVEVPGMGFTWLGPGEKPQPNKKAVALASNNMVRNEHFEVEINETTGAIQAVRTLNRRGNRLSQQLAFRAASKTPRGVAGRAAQD